MTGRKRTSVVNFFQPLTVAAMRRELELFAHSELQDQLRGVADDILDEIRGRKDGSFAEARSKDSAKSVYGHFDSNLFVETPSQTQRDPIGLATLLSRQSPALMQELELKKRQAPGSIISVQSSASRNSIRNSYRHVNDSQHAALGSTSVTFDKLSSRIELSDEEFLASVADEQMLTAPRRKAKKQASLSNCSSEGRSLREITCIEAEQVSIRSSFNDNGDDDGGICMKLKDVVRMPDYEYWNCLLILVHAIVIGVQTDYMARTWSREVPPWTDMLDISLGIWFALDIPLRIWAHGCSVFFHEDILHWHIFDIMIALAQCAMMLTNVDLWLCQESIPVLRFWRCVRMFRLLRAARAMRSVAGVRTLLVSIEHSLKSLGSVVFILLLQTFAFGVFLTQYVTDFKIKTGLHGKEGEGVDEDLQEFWGTLDRSMLSLYEVLSDGIHWHDIVQPIGKCISPWMVLVFSAYICFSLLTVMNVVTGVFVDSALSAASDERKEILLQQMMQLFIDLDADGSGGVSEEEFLAHMEGSQMRGFLKDIDLATQDAAALFDLLDEDSSGEIDAHELIAGLMRVTGPAKAFDFALFMHDHALRLQRIDTRFDQMRAGLDRFRKDMHSLLEAIQENLNDLKTVTKDPQKTMSLKSTM